MKRYTLGFLMALLLVGCSGGGAGSESVALPQAGEALSTGESAQTLEASDSTSNVVVSELQTDNTSAPNFLRDYQAFSYNSHFFFNEDSKKIFVHADFFPTGTNFDYQEHKVTVPCHAQEEAESIEGLSVSVSVPLSGADCDDGVELALNDEEASFNPPGFALSEGAMDDLFVDEFGFSLGEYNFIDAFSGEALSDLAADAGLADIVSRL